MKIETKKIDELLNRGVSEIIDAIDLKRQLLSGKKLRVKLGIDPTSPNLHLGRSVPLLKLKDFQELGHQVIFIVGDFTGMVGDTSDKEAERPALSEKEVKENLKSYLKQAGKIIDIEKTEVRFNSEWLSKLTYKEIGKHADIFSLAQFIARKNIKERLKKENRISLRELLYPLMQGYDSIAIKSDIELGGTDQRFNLLAGREMQVHFNQKPQNILMTNLIDGLDGKKMSSSWGNTINFLDIPEEMFGKVMSMKDEMIIPYFIHCTRVSLEKIRIFEKQLETNSVNPRDIKLKLAFEITKIYWGENGAKKGKKHFSSVVQQKKKPNNITKINISSTTIVNALVKGNLAKSNSDARRLIKQKAVKVNGEKIKSFDNLIKKGDIIQKGKRYFIKII